MNSQTKIQVVIDADLQDIVPGYVESVLKDVIILKEAIQKSQFNTIEGIGHRMKGVAISYGFPLLTDLGKSMELAAKNQDLKTIQDVVQKVEDYLKAVEIVFQ